MMPFKGGDRNLTKGQRWYRRNKRYYRDRAKIDVDRKREQRRRWYRKNADRQKELILRKKYGIGLLEFRCLWEMQCGVCKICRQSETVVHRKSGKVQPLSVDHDHKTGRVRGLLCVRCNNVLGRFRDDPELFERAAAYIRESLLQEAAD